MLCGTQGPGVRLGVGGVAASHALLSGPASVGGRAAGSLASRQLQTPTACPLADPTHPPPLLPPGALKNMPDWL